MAGTKFGQPRMVSGKSVSAESTLVPINYLRDIRPRNPIPISMSTTTFNVNASVTNKVPLWIGDDYFYLEETLTYTWTLASNTILSSAGVVTASQSAALGVWYFYVGINDTTGAYLLYPSQTAPSQVEGPYPGGHLTHPGTSRVRPYVYVGFQVNNDATLFTVINMTKVGYTYNTTDITIATPSVWSEPAFTNAKALPKHGALGLTVNGFLETGVGGTVEVGSASLATTGHLKFSVGASGTVATFCPFTGIVPTANGKVYCKDTTTRGDIHITQIVDIC